MSSRAPETPRALLITGTDTNVGKTIAGGALAAALDAMGLEVGVYKPLESGCASARGKLIPADARFLQWAAECELSLDILCPYQFKIPVAPSVAAKEEGVSISQRTIINRFETVRAAHELVLVEGAGGLLSPLWADKTSADLAAVLKIPLLIVAANKLGMINHTCLTYEAAQSRGLTVLGVVVNDVTRRTRADASRASNAVQLRTLLTCPVYELGHSAAIANLKAAMFTEPNRRMLARAGQALAPDAIARAVLS